MIEYIRRYLFARAVCKKKGIKFVPKFTKRAFGVFNHDYYSKPCKLEISVGLLNGHFYSILAHELGHYIDFELHFRESPFGYYLMYPFHKKCKLNGNPFLSGFGYILLQEMQASKNARRLLRQWKRYSKEEVDFLVRGTYVRYCKTEEKADLAYTGQRYIEGNVTKQPKQDSEVPDQIECKIL